MLKRNAVVFMAALVTAALATGCSGGGEGGNSNSSSSGNGSSGGGSSGGASSIGSPSSDASAGGTSSGGGMSGDSSIGVSGTRASSSNVSSGVDSSGSSPSGASSTGGSAGMSSSGNGVGNLCTPQGGCGDIPQGERACVTFAAGAVEGVCGQTGCTVGETDCGGVNTRCIQAQNGPVCLRTCNAQQPTPLQCGVNRSCVVTNLGAVCAALSNAECDYSAQTTACTGGESCQAVGTDGFGRCISTCDPYKATNPSCTGNTACYADAAGEGICQPTGTVGEGGSCNAQLSCAPTLVCVVTAAGATNGVCRKLCNAGHPCTAGTCTNFPMTTFGACGM